MFVKMTYSQNDTPQLRMEKVYFDVAHSVWSDLSEQYRDKLPEPKPHWKTEGNELVIDYNARNSWIKNGLVPFHPENPGYNELLTAGKGETIRSVRRGDETDTNDLKFI